MSRNFISMDRTCDWTPACAAQFPLRLRAFMRLHQLPVDKDAILLWTEACEKEFSLFLNNDGVFFLGADREFVTFGQADGEHAKVLDGGLPVDANFQIAHELVEREIDPVLF